MNEELGKGSREKEEELRKERMTGTQRGRSRNLVFQAGFILTITRRMAGDGLRGSEGSPGLSLILKTIRSIFAFAPGREK